MVLCGTRRHRGTLFTARLYCDTVFRAMLRPFLRRSSWRRASSWRISSISSSSISSEELPSRSELFTELSSGPLRLKEGVAGLASEFTGFGGGGPRGARLPPTSTKDPRLSASEGVFSGRRAIWYGMAILLFELDPRLVLALAAADPGRGGVGAITMSLSVGLAGVVGDADTGVRGA